MATLTNNMDLWSDEHKKKAPYHEYGEQSSYEMNDGVLQLPVSGSAGNASVLVQLHAPVMRKKVMAWGSRAGKKPLLPVPMPQNQSNEVRGGFSVSPSSPKLDADGTTYHYANSLSCTFYLVSPITSEDGYRMGTSPTTITTADENVYRTSDFTTTLL